MPLSVINFTPARIIDEMTSRCASYQSTQVEPVALTASAKDENLAVCLPFIRRKSRQIKAKRY
jgi:hypothetical protein